MEHDPNDVVKVYSGPFEVVELYEQELKRAGIDCNVVGTALTSVFGGAIPDTNELWVHQRDVEKATLAIERYEHTADVNRHRHHHTPN